MENAIKVHNYAVSLMKPNSLSLAQIAVKTRKYANTLGLELRESVGWNWMHGMGAFFYGQYSLEDYTEDLPLQEGIMLHCHPLIYRTFPKLDPNVREGIHLVNTYRIGPGGAEDLVQRYAVEFVDISDTFHLLKAEKSPDEVACIKKAAGEFDRVFTTIPLLLTGEHTEREIAVALRNRLREMDAQCEDLQTSSMLTMTSAPDGAKSVPEPLPYPGRRVSYGDRVNIQVNGFMPGGFASALGRCYILGKPSEEAQKYWTLAVEAQKLIAEHAKPGTTVAELMELFETKILKPNGLTADTGNQIYGIGAAIYEAPRNVDSTRNLPLNAGMTLVIAPKIVLTGKDPYCCADVYNECKRCKAVCFIFSASFAKVMFFSTRLAIIDLYIFVPLCLIFSASARVRCTPGAEL